MKRAMNIVRAMVFAEKPFEHIEAFIEDVPGLDYEERAVIWLFAWAGAEPSVLARAMGRAEPHVVGV